MSLLGNLSADFYDTTEPSDSGALRKRRTIYSTTPHFTIQPAGAAFPADPNVALIGSDRDLVIYANTLTLRGHFTIPGGSIKICARKVIVPKGDTATLDITPSPQPPLTAKEPGAATGAAGTDGEQGKTGAKGTGNKGSIEFCAESIKCDKPQCVGYDQLPSGAYILEVKSFVQPNITPPAALQALEEKKTPRHKWRPATLAEVEASWQAGKLEPPEGYMLVGGGSVCLPVRKLSDGTPNGLNVRTANNPGYTKLPSGETIPAVHFHEQALTLAQASALAEQNGWRLATLADVTAAWEKDALHYFGNCMLAEGSICVPIQERKGRFPRGVNVASGASQGFLYVEKSVRFYSQSDLTAEQAEQIATKNGWRVASLDEVRTAWEREGLDGIAFGRVDDGSFCVPLNKSYGLEWPPGFHIRAGGNQGFFYVPQSSELTVSNGFYYVQDNASLSYALNFVARGGAGGDGLPGQNGQVGSIGHSSLLVRDSSTPGKVYVSKWPLMSQGQTFLVDYSFSPPRVATQADFASGGGNGGNGGKGGAGGAGGNGGDIGLVIPPGSLKNLAYEVSSGAPGKTGAAGLGGAGGRGGTDTVMRVGPYTDRWGSSEGGNKQVEQIVTERVTDDGIPGRDGAEPDSLLFFGDKTCRCANVTPSSLGEYTDSVFLLKMLMRAKNLYLKYPPYASARAEEAREVADILTWLVTVLGPLKEFSDEPAELARKRYISHQANSLHVRYTHHLNVFGKKADWVPRLALSTYRDAARKLQKTLSTVEKAFATNLQKTRKLAADQAEHADLQQALNDTEANYDEELEELRNKLGPVAQEIEDASQALNEIKSDLVEIFRKEKLEITDYVTCTFDWEGIFKALEMILFTGPEMREGEVFGDLAKRSGPMAALEVGELIYNSINLSNEKAVKKEHVIRSLKYLDGDLKTKLQGEVSGRIEKNANGKLVFKGDQTAALIADLESFEKEIANFPAAFPKDKQDELTLAVSNLKETVQRRGEALLAYNHLITKILQVLAEKGELAAKREDTKTIEAAIADPMLAGGVSLLASLYQNLRNRAGELLYLTERSLAYWSAGMASGGGGLTKHSEKEDKLWLDGEIPTDLDNNGLLSAIDSLETSILEQAEKSSGPPTTTSLDSTKGEYVFSIKDKRQLERFRNKGKLTFATVPGRPTRADEYVVRGLDGCYNIHVLYIRPRLLGVADPDNRGIIVHASHPGKTTLTQRDGTFVEFVHDRVSTAFTYRPKGNSDVGKTNRGLFVDDAATEVGMKFDYALPGLFARWQIYVGEADREALSDVHEIEVEFGIRYLRTS